MKARLTRVQILSLCLSALAFGLSVHTFTRPPRQVVEVCGWQKVVDAS